MRRANGTLLILLVMPGMASAALAADYDLPILRGSSQPPAPVLSVGPATFTRWSGFYVGGNISLGSATSDFSTATRSLVQDRLQHTTLEDQVRPSDFQVLHRGSAVAAGGGAFLGYNTQWQDLVLGAEATYTHTNMNTTAPSAPVVRIFPGLNTQAGIFAAGNLNLTDFGTVRGRAGYVIGILALRLCRYGRWAGKLQRVDGGRRDTRPTYYGYHDHQLFMRRHRDEYRNVPRFQLRKPRRTIKRRALGLHSRRRTGLGVDAEYLRAWRIRVRAICTGHQHIGLGGYRPSRRRP